MARKVVITGLGTVTALGVGRAPLWEGLCAGASGLRRITRFNPGGFPSRLGGEVRDFSAKDFVPKNYRKAVKVMARDIELAVAAAKCAVEDAGLVTRGNLPEGAVEAGLKNQGGGVEGGEDRRHRAEARCHDGTTYPGERMGCHIGAGLIVAETEELAMAVSTARDPSPQFVRANGFSLKAWGTEKPELGATGGMNNLQPLWMLKYLPNMLACHVTIIHGAEGPSNTITCAEASGLLSLGESVRVIERDSADLCFSGCAESKLSLLGMMRVHLTGRLAPTGDAQDGGTIVRPYDPGATGGILGEAGGILILEEKSKAGARGAPVYAEVAGFGAAHSGAGYLHAVGPDRPGADDGLAMAIENSLEDAGVSASEIDAIIPHACGVAALDQGEAGAMRAVFGARLREIPLVTLSPALGECMAGNGAVAASVGALALKHQRLPARIHAGHPAEDLRAEAAPARAARLRYVLVCTSSLGGQNAALVLKAAP